jgi:hypothetical protein
MDFGEPILVSRHIRNDSPGLSIAYHISESWNENMKILPNHLLARIIKNNGYSVKRTDALHFLDEFIQINKLNYLVKQSDEVLRRGLKILADRGIAAEKDGRIISLIPELIDYYSSSVTADETEEENSLEMDE